MAEAGMRVHTPESSQSRRFFVALLLAAWTMPGTPLLGQVILDGQHGSSLQTNLRSGYTPSTVPSLAAAKDLLYGTIDRSSNGSTDGVYGIYTDFFVALDGSPNADPSQDVFNSPNENTLGINLEHSWPQSKGASSGNAQSNMHHLFPSKVNVNAIRGNLPFGEVTDTQTNTWFREATTTTAAPSSAIDEYSEILSGVRFEPREDRKGDIARAMFYFYTIYRSEADAADASFFDEQKDDLRAWNDADPPDAAEIARNTAIASYQSGKINPFVQDPTLVDRAYFDSELPVELAEFSAVVDGYTVRTHWTTLSEQNNSHFVLSVLDQSRTVIASRVLVGSWTSTQTRAYWCNLSVPNSGEYTVRLQQYDAAGNAVQVTSTEIRVVQRGTGLPYPNPAAEYVTWRVEQSHGRPNFVKVYDVAGRRQSINYSSRKIDSGVEYSIETSTLARGVYLLTVSSQNESHSSTFVVDRD